MKGVGIIGKGLEDIGKKEIKEIIKSDSTISNGICVFPIKKLENLCELAYRTQSFSKIMLNIASFNATSIVDFKKKFKEKVTYGKFKEWIKKDSSFCVQCGSTEEFSKMETAALAGELIIKETKKQGKFIPKVSMSKPDTIIGVVIEKNKVFVGVDFCGFDTSKRNYKIFSHKESFKGTTSYGILRLSNFKKGILLDPFCRSGTFVIEAALWLSKTSVNFFEKDKFAFQKLLDINFDKFFKKIDKKSLKKIPYRIIGYDSMRSNIIASKKNAKIAGVEKLIEFSNFGVGWLDTKLDKKSVDVIVTRMPLSGKKANKGVVEKMYKELFYQCEFVLKDDGLMVLATDSEDLIKKHSRNFKIKENREISVGKEKQRVIILQHQKI